MPTSPNGKATKPIFERYARRDKHIQDSPRGYVMSQNLQTKSTNLVSTETNFPKTAAFFDWSLYVMKRTEELIWQGKLLIFSLAFVLFLLYELGHYFWFLIKSWTG